MRFMSRRLSLFKKPKEIRYNIRVSEIFDDTIRPAFQDDLISKVKSVFRSRGICQVAVVHKNYKLIGTVKRSRLLKSSSFSFVKDILDEIGIFTCESSEVNEVILEMLKYKEDCIPVVNEKDSLNYKGILSLENIMDALTKVNTELLNTKIEEIMKKGKSFCYLDDTIFKAWEKMNEEGSTGLFILDNENKVVGVITHHDILVAKAPGIDVAIENHKDTNHITVNKIMNKNVIRVKPTCTLIEAAKTMLKYRIGRLPVVNPESNEYLGSVTKEDIVKHLIQSIL